MSSPSADAHRERFARTAAPGMRPRLRLKRGMDVVVSAAALVFFSPVLALLAVIVRMDSCGPALFRQTRIGMGGRPFEMWKFRTMVRDAPDDLHRNLVHALMRERDGDEPDRVAGPARRRIYKLTDDPRITRVGRWLRRTSLDELPQLFNVFRGDMSLVGPRPPVTYEYEAYATWQLERLAMPQGMTGLWQVSGRNRVNYRRMCELDIEYVRSWSLWLDLKILALTLRAVIVDREPAA